MRKSSQKPSAPTLCAIPSTQAPIALQLTPIELRLIRALRRVDDPEVHDFWAECVENFAKNAQPNRPAKKSALHLVAGGAAQ